MPLFFLIPLAPEVLAGAIALSTAVCTLVTRVGLVHGPKIMELMDILFAEGIASSAAAKHGMRQLAPEVEARLLREFSELPNARTTIRIAHGLVEQALTHGKLYGKEVKAILDATLHYKFKASDITEALHAASQRPVTSTASTSRAKGSGSVVVTPPTGTGPKPQPQNNRHALNNILIKELGKARQGGRGGGV